MKMLQLVSAHTGNDLVDHGFGLVEGLIMLWIFLLLIIIIYYLRKKKKRRMGNEK